MVSSISKDQIISLPIASFDGEIIVVQSEEEAMQAIAHLSECGIIGFDTETRPAFKKGKTHKISLMQLSTEDKCYLFRLNRIGLPQSLLDLLSDPAVVKVGLSLKDDFAAIHKIAPFSPQGFIELQTYVKRFGIEDIGLQRVFAILFNEKISKNQRLSNWEAETLSDSQKRYAATDAWACLKIYNYLEKLITPGREENEL